MLTSKKIAKSKTSHYRIEVTNDSQKYVKDADDVYLGRLRGTLSNQILYIFDKGLKESDIKLGSGSIKRRQLGTICYAQDHYKDKHPRKMEIFLPFIQDNLMSTWNDDESKKLNISFEYG